MKKINERISEFFNQNTAESYAFMIIITLVFVWGAIILMKNLSYWWFYEDLVKETIRHMVKPEYLIQIK